MKHKHADLMIAFANDTSLVIECHVPNSKENDMTQEQHDRARQELGFPIKER